MVTNASPAHSASFSFFFLRNPGRAGIGPLTPGITPASEDGGGGKGRAGAICSGALPLWLMPFCKPRGVRLPVAFGEPARDVLPAGAWLALRWLCDGGCCCCAVGGMLPSLNVEMADDVDAGDRDDSEGWGEGQLWGNRGYP